MTVLGAGLALALAATPACLRDPARRDDTAWLKQHCQLLTEAEEPLVRRADAIFERLRRVVPIGPGVRPELLVVRDFQGLHAYKTSSGAVVISGRVLGFCYGRGGRSKLVGTVDGDSALAFVLAHELRHVAHGDLLRGFDDDSAVREPQARKREGDEQDADAAAIIDMTRAGFRPRAVLGGRRTLLDAWAAATRTQNPPAKRAKPLRLILQRIAESLPLHEAGVLFLEAGRHEEAADLFDAFVRRAQFPGREVLADIGFARHQLALKAVYLCDRAEALRFRLPAVIDPETLAVHTRLRGDARDCRQKDLFMEQIQQALEKLEAALDSDPAYAPARVNLVAALITAGEWTRAMSEAEQAPPGAPEWPEPLRVAPENLHAVAQYLWGDATGLDDVRAQALAKLRELAAHAPGDASVAYNLARMDGSEQAWRRFLALEPDGVWAEAAREALGIPVAAPSDVEAGGDSASQERRCGGDDGGAPAAVALGPVSPATRKRFGASPKLDFSGRELRVHRGEGWAAFELDGAVELVVEEFRPPLSLDAIRERLGPAGSEVMLVGGRRVLRYDGCAYEVDGAEAVRRLVFRPVR